MKLTKYDHSCIVLEDNGQRLIIDPGAWSPSLPDLSDVVAVLTSHEHQDHLHPERIATILKNNPEAQVLAPQSVLDQLSEMPASTKRAIDGGQTLSVGAFSLKMFGHDHATIYQTSPCANVAVLVNDSYYHPGDSFTLPETPVKILGLPVSAPWLKLSEVIDFALSVKPEVAMPIHEVMLSEFGMMVTERNLQPRLEAAGIAWHVLKPGESLDC